MPETIASVDEIRIWLYPGSDVDVDCWVVSFNSPDGYQYVEGKFLPDEFATARSWAFKRGKSRNVRVSHYTQNDSKIILWKPEDN